MELRRSRLEQYEGGGGGGRGSKGYREDKKIPPGVKKWRHTVRHYSSAPLELGVLYCCTGPTSALRKHPRYRLPRLFDPLPLVVSHEVR